MFSVRALTRAYSSTFQDLDFDVSLSPLFINWCYNHGMEKLPNHWWTRWYYFGTVNFFLSWNFDKQNEMQLLAKFKQILCMAFRATLNFRKFKVALNPMYGIALNVSLNLSIYYSFRHVLKPGTPEHRNTITLRNTPDNRYSQESPEQFDDVVLFSQYRSCKKKINVDVNVICFLRKTKELRARYKVYVSGAHY